ncbi:hypothetical protein BVX94_03000 [bacterium B17]|nr:hypothetical protein BVX94_03000 [bacterium B17]
MPDLKNKFNFRLGTTSYIIPADYTKNVKYLADKVNDIQLIMFEADGITSLPTENGARELIDIAEEHNLTYSIHFPLDTELGAEEQFRKWSVDKHLEIIELTESLPCSAYIVHFNGDGKDYTSRIPSDDMERWSTNNRQSIEEIITRSGKPSSMFCVETLSYPFDMVEDIVLDCNTSVCLDIGHLIVNGYSIEEHLDRWLDRTGSIHLHGVEGTTDHMGLSHLDSETLIMLLSRIEEMNEMVLTVEVFNEEKFKESMKVLEDV